MDTTKSHWAMPAMLKAKCDCDSPSAYEPTRTPDMLLAGWKMTENTSAAPIP